MSSVIETDRSLFLPLWIRCRKITGLDNAWPFSPKPKLPESNSPFQPAPLFARNLLPRPLADRVKDLLSKRCVAVGTGSSRGLLLGYERRCPFDSAGGPHPASRNHLPARGYFFRLGLDAARNRGRSLPPTSATPGVGDMGKNSRSFSMGSSSENRLVRNPKL